jgi:ferrochelatase
VSKIPKIGILLVNLGTPKNPSFIEIAKYLREFLSDPRVIDLPKIIRLILVYVIILPTRPFKAKQAYSKIWSKAGSPLRYISNNVTTKLQQKIEENYLVAGSMRYGEPSIASGVQKLKDCSKIIVLPLFPQYSSAATGSATEKAMNEISKLWNIPDIQIINSFYQHESFIKAYSNNISAQLKQQKHAFLLFSYHGLPTRHIAKSNCTYTCAGGSNPCPSITKKNHFCYKAQCYATSKLIAKELELDQESYSTSFQSRLGKTPWIPPYTDDMLLLLREREIENLVIACPAFVTDCLETLEEIGMEAKKTWLQLGGKNLTLVPCLNDDDLWISSIIDIIKNP